jgi:serine/threonine-protein kinase
VKQCPGCNRQFADSDEFCPFDGQHLFEVLRTPEVFAHAPPDARTRAQPVQTPQPELTHDYLVGTTLDARYKIERRVGEGGMGIVFLARHIVIEKSVAIKILKRDVARDQNVVRRFVQEAKAASRIGHPNIVDVTDFGTTPDGTTYSVMEYVEGRTLAEVIKTDGRLFVSRAVPIVVQIARALGAAHDKGIVHRDLKPENIFLVNSGGRVDFVKIVDFGIAKVTSVKKVPTQSPRLTRQGTVFGTPEYMPPEQASGWPDLDRRVDIYALGIILYEMLVGRVPHKGDSLMETLTMQINDPILPPTQIAPDLQLSEKFENVLLRTVAKDREQRYQSMSELIGALEKVAGNVSDNVRREASRPPQVEPAVAGPAEPTLSPERDDAKTVREPPRATPMPGDPMFTGTGARTVRRFDDVMDGSATEPDIRERSSKLPALVAAVLVIGAIGVGAAVLLQAGGDTTAAATAPDAAIVAVVPVDAAAPPVDAMLAVVEPDAAPETRGKRGKTIAARHGSSERNTPGGLVSIVVETRPRGGTLIMSDGAYGGTDGTTLTRRGGHSLDVKCKLSGYTSGTTRLVFDGITDVAVCRMTRIKKCIPGVKNPFDDCTDVDP